MDGHQYTAAFEAPGGKPVLKAYPDPKTGGDPQTIGLGHTGIDVKQGDVWSYDKCMAIYYNDYAVAVGGAAHVVGSACWASLTEPRKAVLADMVFNVGATKLKGFVKMLDAVRRSQWQRAHDEILDSQYAHDVKGRAVMNANVMLTGTWPGEAMA